MSNLLWCIECGYPLNYEHGLMPWQCPACGFLYDVKDKEK